jgi:hypothetical protein
MTARDQLSPVLVARDVLTVYRRHWVYLVPAAVVILLPQALADAFLDGLQVEGVRSARDVAILSAVPLTVAVNLLGQAIYAGFAASAVVEWRAGFPVPGIARLVRALPVRRLVVVDLILSIGAAVGFALVVVPGLLFLAVFGITPAIVKFEHLGTRDAFARSAALVRGHFWRVFAIVVGAIVLTEAAVQAIAFPFHGLGLVAMVDLAAAAVVEPFEGLVIVLVALTLLEMRGESPAPRTLAFAPAGK